MTDTNFADSTSVRVNLVESHMQASIFSPHVADKIAVQVEENLVEDGDLVVTDTPRYGHSHQRYVRVLFVKVDYAETGEVEAERYVEIA